MSKHPYFLREATLLKRPTEGYRIAGSAKEKACVLQFFTGINLWNGLDIFKLCPLEFHLFADRSRKWSCDVALRVRHPRRSGPTEELVFADDIRLRRKAALTIHQAQRAFLKPRVELDHFRKLTLPAPGGRFVHDRKQYALVSVLVRVHACYKNLILKPTCA